MKNFILFSLSLLMVGSICAQQRISDEVRQEIKREVKDQLESKKTFLEKAASKVKIFGDLRVRPYDQDWNVSIAREEGLVEKRDRARMRFRLRLNLKADITKNVLVHTRFRTGDDQFDLITAGSNDESSASLHVDKIYTKFHIDGFWLTLGRNTGIYEGVEANVGGTYDRSLPNHDGYASGYKFKFGEGSSLDLAAAYYIDKQRSDKKDGKTFGGQLTFNTKVDPVKFKVYTSFRRVEYLPNTFPITVLNNKDHFSSDMAPDYALWYSGIQLSLPSLKDLTLIAHYYKNLKKYDENPDSRFHNFTKNQRDFTDQTNGYGITLQAGSLKKAKNFYGGVSWLHLEKYAFIDYYWSDYFNRTNEFGPSNLELLKLFAGYAFTKRFNILTRLYFTNQLVGFSDDPDEKGSARRFKLDLNYKF